MAPLKLKTPNPVHITGAPSRDVSALPSPETVAVNGQELPFTKPRLLVKEGDKVKIGTPIFLNKKDDRILCTSPAGGTIDSIEYGERRTLLNVVIKVDAKESSEKFAKLTEKSTRDDVVDALLKGGLWQLFRELPFKNIPSPDSTPPMIVVNIDDSEPFNPEASVYMANNTDQFRFGIAMLQKLSEKVVVTAVEAPSKVKDLVTQSVKGEYPVTDPETTHYQIKQSAEDNKAWILSGQDVILIGQLLSGTYPTEKTIVVAGPQAAHPQHYTTRIGSPISHILKGQSIDSDIRVVSGGLLTGSKTDATQYISLKSYAINLIQDMAKTEMLSFLRLGFNKPTFSRTYLSFLTPKKKFDMTGSLNGSLRSCVACGKCPEVCPVGLLPQFLLKSIVGDDTEEAVHLGLLDCTDCGLCTYVCPSKIELGTIFKTSKNALAKEVGL